MRVRKLKWAEAFLENQSVIVSDPAVYKDKWHELLPQSELHVEIGSGKGDYWIGMSQLYPECGWIGIEKNTSVAALALKKIENAENPNRRFIVLDAEHIEDWFDHEISVLHLNFSDPWPKKRNSKRRLSHTSFLNQYRKILKSDGKIIMKSDNRALFEYSILEFQNNGFVCEEIYLDFRSSEHAEDTISEYEAKFMAKGNPIYRGVWHL